MFNKKLHIKLSKFIIPLYESKEDFNICYSYFRYSNEQSDRIERILIQSKLIDFIEIIIYWAYTILRIIKSFFLRTLIKKNHMDTNDLLFYENEKYIDVVDEITSQLKYSNRTVNHLEGYSFRRTEFHLSSEFFFEIIAQIKFWRIWRHSLSKESRKIFSYIFWRDLLYLSVLKSSLKEFPSKLYTTNYISELSLILGQRANKVYAFKRGLTGLGPELSCYGVDIIYVKDILEKKFFSNNNLVKKLKIDVAHLYDEVVEADYVKDSSVRNVLLYLTQPTSQFFPLNNQKEELSCLINVAKLSKMKLMIKIHPSDSFNYSAYCRDHNYSEVIIEESLSKAILSCEMGITKFSGTGLDLIKRQKHLILLNGFHNYPEERNYYSIADIGIKYCGKSINELVSIIGELRKSQVRQTSNDNPQKLSKITSFIDN
jgi:hypothetical protein